ncbi:regulatory LuxR family protein [Chitinophaga dinghuensis]|uniref:Regulatory LuxR family protein n=1 Tax=Chitinophaga dinghuensis TaxID=1539050 RepID=A0A327VRL7_9BACT|nr:triple tyrosine motif-containing protein [Chitinophaga dinghuensis]RAJ76700.1 regulatory LuxR family protein [Chitinophaga dinghuensis]
MKFIRYLLFHVLSFACTTLSAQHTIGLPAIASYDRMTYKGNGQTWDIDIDQKGMLFFANNEGLITFNGSNWHLFQVPNKTRVRSVKVGENGRIYVGAQDEFGYFAPNLQGCLQYTSLKPNIPKAYQQFADVWNIVPFQDHYFFRTNNKIFRLDNKGKIDVSLAAIEWKILGSTGKNLYAEDYNTGLYRFENNSWKLYSSAVTDKQLVITAFLEENNDTLLVTTVKDGLVKIFHDQVIPVHTAADVVFRNTHIYCGLKLNERQYAIGTFSNGCYIIDLPSGKVLQRFSRDEGMQNNNVLKIFADESQQLWMALENGIDHIQYNAAIQRIAPDKNNLIGAYAAAVFKNQLYIGTIDGLYVTPLDGNTDYSLSRSSFSRIPNTSGQVWRLSQYEDHLLMGHSEGTYEIVQNKATALLEGTGSWIYLPITNRLIAGCYTGLSALQLQNNQFRVQPHINGLYESLRFLAPDGNGNVWSSHPYRGIYHLQFTADSLQYTLYTQGDGLPSNYNNFVYTLAGKMVVTTPAGLYEFDSNSHKFRPSPHWQALFGNIAIQYLREDPHGNIWFVSDRKVGLADVQTKRIIYFPELSDKIITGFEFIYPYNDENIFFAGDKGILHLNYRKYSQQHTGPMMLMGSITTTSKQQDSLLYGGYSNGSALAEISLPNAWRNFRFEFSSPAAAAGNNIQYSYQLQGFDKEPSTWTSKTEKEYTNIPFGHYTFRVVVRDNLGNISTPATYSFYIEPAWYQSWYAWCVYGLLLVLLIIAIRRRQRRRLAAQQEKHRQEQQQLIIQHQLEIERNEMQLVKLTNDKLQADVQHKNKELATAAMNIVQNGKTLADIKEALLESMKKLSDPSPLPKFRKVMKLFEEAENDEESWADFSRHFDEVHNNFLLTLKKKFPELTTTDLKLCAYLRINLSTKEIAQTMGISVRGVETSRYRLRKKLDISGDINLYDFLLEVAS